MFKTFKAKIHGSVVMSALKDDPIDTTLTFTKYRIRINEKQQGRLFLDPMGVLAVVDKMEYRFDKLLNRDDKKMFSIIRKHKLNNLDNGIHHLEIDTWNRFKANVIHHRYWLDREKEWFVKTLLAALVGFVFSLVGLYLGYRQGYQNGIKAGQATHQDTTLKR